MNKRVYYNDNMLTIKHGLDYGCDFFFKINAINISEDR